MLYNYRSLFPFAYVSFSFVLVCACRFFLGTSICYRRKQTTEHIKLYEPILVVHISILVCALSVINLINAETGLAPWGSAIQPSYTICFIWHCYCALRFISSSVYRRLYIYFSERDKIWSITTIFDLDICFVSDLKYIMPINIFTTMLFWNAKQECCVWSCLSISRSFLKLIGIFSFSIIRE